MHSALMGGVYSPSVDNISQALTGTEDGGADDEGSTSIGAVGAMTILLVPVMVSGLCMFVEMYTFMLPIAEPLVIQTQNTINYLKLW